MTTAKRIERIKTKERELAFELLTEGPTLTSVQFITRAFDLNQAKLAELMGYTRAGVNVVFLGKQDVSQKFWKKLTEVIYKLYAREGQP